MCISLEKLYHLANIIVKCTPIQKANDGGHYTIAHAVWESAVSATNLYSSVLWYKYFA